mmetsp:Transcript_85302/g.151109  ORF Transcript_85302/g.151109 Transcript_85302/m.151109 type:complete len:299 (-) Transcript_85302:109-1005(-)
MRSALMRWLVGAVALLVTSLPVASAAGLRAASNSYAHLRVARGRAGSRGESAEAQASESPAKAEEEEEAAEEVEPAAEEKTSNTPEFPSKQADVSPPDVEAAYFATEEAAKESDEKADEKKEEPDEEKSDLDEKEKKELSEEEQKKADDARASQADRQEQAKAGANAEEEAITTPPPAPTSPLPDSIPADFFSNAKYSTCSPPCIEGRGVCNDNTCFCKSPYRGSTCQKTVKDETVRIAYSVLAGMVAISMFVGCIAANCLFVYLTLSWEKKASYLGEAKARKEEWSPEAAAKKKSKT